MDIISSVFTYAIMHLDFYENDMHSDHIFMKFHTKLADWEPGG